MFQLQPIEPGRLVRPDQLRLCAPGEIQEEAEMPLADGRDLARPKQPIAAVLPHGLEEAVPAVGTRGLFDDYEGLVEQARQQIEHLVWLDTLA